MWSGEVGEVWVCQLMTNIGFDKWWGLSSGQKKAWIAFKREPNSFGQVSCVSSWCRKCSVRCKGRGLVWCKRAAKVVILVEIDLGDVSTKCSLNLPLWHGSIAVLPPYCCSYSLRERWSYRVLDVKSYRNVKNISVIFLVSWVQWWSSRLYIYSVGFSMAYSIA